MIETTIHGYKNKSQKENVFFDSNTKLAIESKIIKHVDIKFLKLKKYIKKHLPKTDTFSTYLTELNKLTDNNPIISKDTNHNQAILKMKYLESFSSKKFAFICNLQNCVFKFQKSAISNGILQLEDCSSSVLTVVKKYTTPHIILQKCFLIPNQINATLQMY